MKERQKALTGQWSFGPTLSFTARGCESRDGHLNSRLTTGRPRLVTLGDKIPRATVATPIVWG